MSRPYPPEPACMLVSQVRQQAEIISLEDRKSTRLNSSHLVISYAVFCLKKKKTLDRPPPSPPFMSLTFVRLIAPGPPWTVVTSLLNTGMLALTSALTIGAHCDMLCPWLL